MTKYIVVQDSRPFPHSPTARHQKVRIEDLLFSPGAQ